VLAQGLEPAPGLGRFSRFNEDNLRIASALQKRAAEFAVNFVYRLVGYDEDLVRWQADQELIKLVREPVGDVVPEKEGR
jgi:hypothetical protein